MNEWNRWINGWMGVYAVQCSMSVSVSVSVESERLICCDEVKRSFG